MRIYLAGPLFSISERRFNSELRVRLEAFGHTVWLPQEHEPRDKSARAIFEMNVSGIAGSEIVVANMDGADPDSGTAWECGHAYGRMPIILFRTDLRGISDAPDAPFNLMLSAGADAVVTPEAESIAVLAGQLDRAIIGLNRT